MTQGYETKFSSFDEWVKTKNGMVDTWVRGAKSGFEAGAASRQDEVSKLKTDVDELNFKLAEMKSRLNDTYTDGQTSMYKTKQTEIDELKKHIKSMQKVAQRIMIAIDDGEIEYARRSAIKMFKGENNE